MAGAACLASSEHEVRDRRDAQISGRRQAEEVLTFSDSEIGEGFFLVAFGAELQPHGNKDHIRNSLSRSGFLSTAKSGPDCTAALIAVAADIKAHVPDLDIQVTGDKEAANVIVTTVREKAFGQTLTKHFGAVRGGSKSSKIAQAGAALGIAKDKTFLHPEGRSFSAVKFSDFTFYDCAYEELLQSLGADQ